MKYLIVAGVMLSVTPAAAQQNNGIFLPMLGPAMTYQMNSYADTMIEQEFANARARQELQVQQQLLEETREQNRLMRELLERGTCDQNGECND